MGEKRESAGRLADAMRRTVLLEPRGHADLLGAVLTEPTQPGSDAGVLFMDADGFVAMSGHGAALTIVLVIFTVVRNVKPGVLGAWLASESSG